MVLEAWLLGRMELRYNRHRLDESAFHRRHALVLLLCLLLAPGYRVERDAALSLLWPEQLPQERMNDLRSVLSSLRRTLSVAAAGPTLVQRDGTALRLHPNSRVEVDVARFEASARAALSGRDLGSLHDAAALYGGPLLPPFPYAEWSMAPRARLARLHERLLAALARSEAPLNPDAAEEWLHALLSANPTDERAARALMTLLARRGRRAEALRIYEELRHTLQRDLDAAPSSAVERLHRALRDPAPE